MTSSYDDRVTALKLDCTILHLELHKLVGLHVVTLPSDGMVKSANVKKSSLFISFYVKIMLGVFWLLLVGYYIFWF